jgi:hypothetical protein
MRKYVKSEPNIDQLLDRLYGDVRSAHFHAGAFPLGEYDRRSVGALLSSDYVLSLDLSRQEYETTREAIVNWAMSHVPPLATSDDVPD